MAFAIFVNIVKMFNMIEVYDKRALKLYKSRLAVKEIFTFPHCSKSTHS